MTDELNEYQVEQRALALRCAALARNSLTLGGNSSFTMENRQLHLLEANAVATLALFHQREAE